MDQLLLQPFVRLLDEVSDTAAVRRAESGENCHSIWAALLESGFVDALVDEPNGGAGLAPADVAPLFLAAGRQLLPVAFAETAVARALAFGAGIPLTIDSPVVLWPADHQGRLQSLVPPVAAGASHALLQRGTQAELRLLRNEHEQPNVFGLNDAILDEQAAPLLQFELPANTLLYWAAALTTAAMAGAASRVLELTLAHVNDRQQFGRPIARFQAIQQQVSVLAERVVMMNMAARVALSGPMPGPKEREAAIGKCVASDAATLVCTIAHAAHGAIGISAEHDLSLHTRRLKRWQLSFGSSDYWSQLVGRLRLESSSETSVDFLRDSTPAALPAEESKG